MLLSKILNKINMKETFQIYNEQEFQRLQLVDHISDEKGCVFLDDIKYLGNVKKCVSMIICSKDIDINELLTEDRGLCVVENPRIVFFELHNYLMQTEEYSRKKEDTTVDESASVADTAVIAPKNVKIGKNVIVEDLVVIKENTIIGDNTIIRSGSVIGNVGYEFKKNGQQIIPVTHGGGVIIGKNVIIGANVVVDKAVYPWDDTIVGDECKIDSLVFLAHGVKLRQAVMVVAQALIAGRTVVESKAKVGPGAVIRNAMNIGKGANVSMGSVVTQDVPEYANVTGNFAISHEKFMKHIKEIS